MSPGSLGSRLPDPYRRECAARRTTLRACPRALPNLGPLFALLDPVIILAVAERGVQGVSGAVAPSEDAAQGSDPCALDPCALLVVFIARSKNLHNLLTSRMPTYSGLRFLGRPSVEEPALEERQGCSDVLLLRHQRLSKGRDRHG